MKLSRRDNAAAESETVDITKESTAGSEEVTAKASTAKGRPTPKRRDSQGKRGPVTAPKTRKEAYARQKAQAKEQRSAAKSAKPRSVAEQRAALKRGDPDALPRRDQGKTRKLARDWVDSRRMLSNYLLLIFPIMIIASFVPALAAVQIVVLFALVVLIGEWYITGKRVRALAMERYGEADGGNMSIGFYAGSRAYMPRRWRLPGPQVERGDEI
ncbi:DUF3043 domain-containing protein [Jatrophihabitans fulvus]